MRCCTLPVVALVAGNFRPLRDCLAGPCEQHSDSIACHPLGVESQSVAALHVFAVAGDYKTTKDSLKTACLDAVAAAVFLSVRLNCALPIAQRIESRLSPFWFCGDREKAVAKENAFVS